MDGIEPVRSVETELWIQRCADEYEMRESNGDVLQPVTLAVGAELSRRAKERASLSGSRIWIAYIIVVGVAATLILILRHDPLLTVRHGLWFVVIASLIWPLLGNSIAIRKERRDRVLRAYKVILILVGISVALSLLGLDWLLRGDYGPD